MSRQTERKNNSTPFIGICFEAGGKEFNIQCIADTGSSKGIMSSKISDSYGLELDTSRKIKLFNANGKMMKVIGVTKAKCYPQIMNGRKNTGKGKCVETEFIVSSDVKANILLSCNELKLMGIIPEDFPKVNTEEESMRICHCNKKLIKGEDENID